MNLALTSKTPTASDGEISKMTFLNLQREEEGEVRKAAVISICKQFRNGEFWTSAEAELTGWAEGPRWRSARLSHGAVRLCTSGKPACSSSLYRLVSSIT